MQTRIRTPPEPPAGRKGQGRGWQRGSWQRRIWPGTFRSARPTGSALLLSLFPLLLFPGSAASQGTEAPTGWELSGVPAVNYDSDEGFGYGVVLAVYDYGSEGILPYRTTLQPRIFFTTEGRRDLTIFFDAPHLPGGWRLDAFLGQEKQIATPYYGLGNQAAYEPALESGENPYYYRFGRERNVFRANLQWSLGALPLSILAGGQVARFTVDPTPKNEGSTLLLEELGVGAPIPGGYENSVRVGLVWDTRDRESGPEQGVWTTGLVERVDRGLGSESSYTRWTLTDRRYFPLARHLVLANRITLQTVAGDPPFYALSYVKSSFGESEGLGGSKSVRGVLRNRYSGKGICIWNLELRWRARDFGILGRDAHLALVGFLDSGRVWEGGLDLSSVLADLHRGGGGGVRVGVGPNFVVALDFAGSGEAGLQTYVGLGYLF
jgi:hypothetical protein